LEHENNPKRISVEGTRSFFIFFQVFQGLPVLNLLL
jgi:hypothetical protein